MRTSRTDTIIEVDGEQKTLGEQEIQELSRGVVGALFVSLPLLYTMEMWQIGATLPDWALLGWVALGLLLTCGYVAFAGFRGDPSRTSLLFDAVTALGIGLVVSLTTLLLIGRYDLGDSPRIIAHMALLEMVPTGMGAAVARNQLGGGDSGSKGPAARLAPYQKMIAGSVLGAFLFVINIAPTVETQVIANSVSWWHVLALIVFTLGVSYMTVFVAWAGATDSDQMEGLGGPISQTVVGYAVALLSSWLLLTMFGYIDLSTPLAVQVVWVTVLAYGTALAGAAGRVIL